MPEHWAICLAGEPVTRKTTTGITTLRPEDYPALVLDLDGKAAEEWRIQPFVQDGRVKIVEVMEPLTEQPLPITREEFNAPATSEPRGWAKVGKMVNLVRRAMEQSGGKVEGIRPATFIIDPITLVFKYLEQYICFTSQVGTINELPHGAGWKLLERNVMRFMIQFRALRKYMNILATAHIHDKTDQKTQRTDKRPLIDGQARDMFIGYWPNVFEMVVEGGQGRMRTRGEESRYIARTTMQLEQFEPADIAAVLAKAAKAGAANRKEG